MGNADGSPMQCVFARCVECRKERDELRAQNADLKARCKKLWSALGGISITIDQIFETKAKGE